MRRAVALACLVGFLASLKGCTTSLDDRFERGLDMLFEGRYEDAESHFLTLGRELARSNEPDSERWHARALYHAGRVEHLYLDQPRRAVARLREALKLDPHAPFAFDAREEIAFIFYDRLRDYRTAALEFERLVHAFSDRKGIEVVHYRIAQCYFLLREFDQARTEARLLLERQKEGQMVAEAMLLIANSYYVEGRYQEAAKAYRELLEIHPGEEIESRSRFELGLCHMELKEFKLAERNLLLALQKHPRPDMVRRELRVMQERMSEEDQGKELPYATAGRQPPVAAVPVAPRNEATPRPKKTDAGSSAPAPAPPKAPEPRKPPEAKEKETKEPSPKPKPPVKPAAKKPPAQPQKKEAEPKAKPAPAPAEKSPPAPPVEPKKDQ